MGKPRDDRSKDLFRPALEEIIDKGHALVRLANEIDWSFLDQRFSAVCQPGPGQPPLPTRLVAGPLILKHTHNLSDEVLCARWLENPYYQYFCGEEVFYHRLPFDRTSLRAGGKLSEAVGEGLCWRQGRSPGRLILGENISARYPPRNLRRHALGRDPRQKRAPVPSYRSARELLASGRAA